MNFISNLTTSISSCRNFWKIIWCYQFNFGDKKNIPQSIRRGTCKVREDNSMFFVGYNMLHLSFMNLFLCLFVIIMHQYFSYGGLCFSCNGWCSFYIIMFLFYYGKKVMTMIFPSTYCNIFGPSILNQAKQLTKYLMFCFKSFVHHLIHIPLLF
jgi:hypothetical protein